MKYKRIITGQYVAPNQIRISTLDTERVQEGQRVLVCKPTGSNIVNYSTGKVIGQKEKVIGTGIVKIKNGIVMVRTKTNGTKAPRLNNLCAVGIKTKERSTKIGVIKEAGVNKVNEVIIKPIEE